MRIRREKTFAIGVDYQEKLLPAIKSTENLLDNSCKLLKALNILGVPVYFSQQYTKGLGQTVEEIREAAGTEAYTEKIRFSAYDDMKDTIPAKEEAPFAVICGVESHVCVLQTAIDLKEAGYQPVLVSDCIGSRKVNDYKGAIRRAKQEGILIATYEMLLYELMESADIPERKLVQRVLG